MWGGGGRRGQHRTHKHKREGAQYHLHEDITSIHLMAHLSQINYSLPDMHVSTVHVSRVKAVVQRQWQVLTVLLSLPAGLQRAETVITHSFQFKPLKSRIERQQWTHCCNSPGNFSQQNDSTQFKIHVVLITCTNPVACKLNPESTVTWHTHDVLCQHNANSTARPKRREDRSLIPGSSIQLDKAPSELCSSAAAVLLTILSCRDGP